MFSAIKQRDDRLNKILQDSPLDNLPLLKSKKLYGYELITDWHYINSVVQEYIKHTVSRYHQIPYFEMEKASLDDINRAGLIKSLPNLTPNGILLPKKETIKYYEPIQNEIGNALNNLGIDKYINKIHFPVTVRIVYGGKNELDNRPRASSKIHTDVWSGEPTNTTMAFIPIHGDFENVGVNFYETPEDIVNWLRPLDSYDEGADITSKAQNNKYDVCLKLGRLYLSDPLLLHATNKQLVETNNKFEPWRISVDFRFISNIPCEYDVNDNLRESSYIDYEDWSNIGKNWIEDECMGKTITTESSLYDKYDNPVDEKPRNEYSGKYSLKSWNLVNAQ